MYAHYNRYQDNYCRGEATMRDEFQADLREVARLLVTMAEAVHAAMREATTALLNTDQSAAKMVIDRDIEVDLLYRDVEEKVSDLIARQAPVASDMRTVITALHISADLERMGDLSSHVAKAVLRRHPATVVPPELSDVIGQMGQVADRMADKIEKVLSMPDALRAAELERDDDAMDDLEHQLFAKLLGPDWPHGVQAAVDSALLGRFYERYADHAVNAGRRIIYMITGEPRTT